MWVQHALCPPHRDLMFNLLSTPHKGTKGQKYRRKLRLSKNQTWDYRSPSDSWATFSHTALKMSEASSSSECFWMTPGSECVGKNLSATLPQAVQSSCLSWPMQKSRKVQRIKLVPSWPFQACHHGRTLYNWLHPHQINFKKIIKKKSSYFWLGTDNWTKNNVLACNFWLQTSVCFLQRTHTHHTFS